MKIKTYTYTDALVLLTDKHGEAIVEDSCARIPLTVAIPSTTTLGEIMETLFWTKGYECIGEVIIESQELRHWGFSVSVKAEYLNPFLVSLFGGTHGMVYEEVQ